MLIWNFHYLFRLVLWIYVCIVMVIGFNINRLCKINSLEYFNLLVLLKLFLENSVIGNIQIFHPCLLLKLLQCIFGTILRHID